MTALAIRLRRGAPVLLRLLPPNTVDALRLAATVVVAFFLAMALELDTPEWAGWTVLSVSLSTRASSLQKSLWRAIGSVVGGGVAVAVVAEYAQSTLALDAAIAFWVGLAAALSSVEQGQRSYGFALVGFTVPIVALGVVQQPTRVFSVAVDRCSTILLGIACAHASSVLVARGTGRLGRDLADAIDRTAATCADWIERSGTGDVGAPPVPAVLALDQRIFDAMVEQSSLRSGGRFLGRAAVRLLSRLTAAFAAPLLGGPDAVVRAGVLLDLPGSGNGEGFRRRRLAVVARLVREERRIGRFRAAPRALALDRDWVQARNNAIRAALAVGMLEAFTYVAEWPSGAVAATWAGVISALFAARTDAAEAARDFLFGGLLAVIVALPLHFTVLTVSGHFGLLAAVLFPVAFVAALGRGEQGVRHAAGFGFLVFGALSIHERMTYDLAADLNGVLAELAGIAVAAAAFRALPPPASAERRARRARRRMAHGLRVLVHAPRALLPNQARWIGRSARQLVAARPDDMNAEELGAVRALLLAGLLVRALREEDDRMGRAAGVGFLGDAAGEPVGAVSGLAAARLEWLEWLRNEPGLTGWPGFPQNGRR